MRVIPAVLLVVFIAFPALGASLSPPEGWAVHATSHTHAALVDRVKKAVKANGLIVVTQAGPTKAAARRGITIPGNRVIGVYNNDYAVRVIRLSVAAMIEAPIRMYVTENPDQTATLSYKRPSHVFRPYYGEGGAALQEIAKELDERFLAIAEDAASE